MIDLRLMKTPEIYFDTQCEKTLPSSLSFLFLLCALDHLKVHRIQDCIDPIMIKGSTISMKIKIVYLNLKKLSDISMRVGY